MRILEQRFLRGPNVHADSPCLLSVLDLQEQYGRSTSDIPGFNDALLQLLPSLRGEPLPGVQPGGFAQRLQGGTYLGRVVETVTLALQTLAGAPASFGRTRPVTGHPGQVRIVCAYSCEKLAEPAFDLAVDLVAALARGDAFDLAPRLDALREIVARYAVDAGAAAVLAAAQERGIPVQRITEDADLFMLGWGVRQKRLQGTMTGDTSFIALKLAADRALCRTLLKEAGVPVPDGEVVTTLEAAWRAARRLGLPVTVKPAHAAQGLGIGLACATQDAVEHAFACAREQGRRVLVERHIVGHGYRVLVAGGRVAACARRLPAQVVGDGIRTIRALVDEENAGALRKAAVLAPIRLDEHAHAALARQGMDADGVLPVGVVAALRDDAGLAIGGAGEDVTGLLPESTRLLCVRAAARIGLDVAGIDLVCREIGTPLAAQGGAVVGIDAGPGLQRHADGDEPGAAIVDALMKGGDGRIPVIALTGTNGKTTTTLLVAHTVRMAGKVTGVTTTEGVFIDGKRVARGDCTGYWSARTVLGAPDVEFAVLETARGGILKRGLAFDRCDVAIVLNIAADHLGLDSVDTVEDLAQVKAVVAQAASKALVLNAEDALCVQMARRARPSAEILFFAMDAENPVLLKHLEDGGRGAYLQDGELVVANGHSQQALLKVGSMPVAFGGLARFNIANALAAASGLMAAGFGHAQIAAGLSTFVSDGRSNPLRTNIFDVRGVTVIVDYAHNPAAYAAMAGMARAMLPAQLVGIVTAPGDRRDVDLCEVGRVCGAGFDELVVYESQSRGRKVGEAVDLILQGAESVVGKSDTLHRVIAVGDAIRHGLDLCRPGDVLVFACGSSLQVFVDAIRQDDPDSADRIAAQTV